MGLCFKGQDLNRISHLVYDDLDPGAGGEKHFTEVPEGFIGGGKGKEKERKKVTERKGTEKRAESCKVFTQVRLSLYPALSCESVWI